MAVHIDGEAPAPVLVRSFLASATEAFRPLVAGPGGRWSTSVMHATGSEIVPVPIDEITGFFFVDAEFSTQVVAGQISFGDREYLVNTVLGRAGDLTRYGLWEWADALGQPGLVPSDTGFVRTVSRMESIVAAMARAVTDLQASIGAASRDVVDRMDMARERVLAEHQARLRADDHRRASFAASDAFHHRDYGRVVELLLPFTESLSPAERHKLEYARRHRS